MNEMNEVNEVLKCIPVKNLSSVKYVVILRKDLSRIDD